jgi:hypothetical protein
VQEKIEEARIPSMKSHRDRYAVEPSLRRFNALERFKTMVSDVHGIDLTQEDMARAAALKANIEEYDPAVHGPIAPEREPPPDSSGEDLSESTDARADTVADAEARPAGVQRTTGTDSEDTATVALADNVFPVSEPVESGDLVALDAERPGMLRRAGSAADPSVIGIVAREASEEGDTWVAPLHDSQFATLKVDAGYGAIRAGDLLTTSPTPGHAMVTLAPVPGTVVGKALESLGAGTGRIKVLVMPH